MKIKTVLYAVVTLVSGVSIGLVISLFLITSGATNSSYKAFVVLSGSMEPALPVGSMVFTKSKPNYKVGEIISFNQGNKTITHRVAGKKHTDNTFLTKGDANEEADTWSVAQQEIIGASVFHIPYIGYFSEFVRTPKGFVAFVVIPASIIIYEELKKIFNELKRFIQKKLPESDKKGLPRASALIPITGVFLLFAIGSNSYFSDIEDSTQNTIEASDDYGYAQGIVINEVLPDSSCSVGIIEAQWIEIYNGTLNTVNLNGYEINDGTSTLYTIGDDLFVDSGDLVLVSHNNSIWNPSPVGCYDDNGTQTFSLGGNPQIDLDTGHLELLDASDVLVDEVDWAGLNQDESIERIPKGLGNFVTQTIPTPGL